MIDLVIIGALGASYRGFSQGSNDEKMLLAGKS